MTKIEKFNFFFFHSFFFFRSSDEKRKKTIVQKNKINEETIGHQIKEKDEV